MEWKNYDLITNEVYEVNGIGKEIVEYYGNRVRKKCKSLLWKFSKDEVHIKNMRGVTPSHNSSDMVLSPQRLIIDDQHPFDVNRRPLRPTSALWQPDYFPPASLGQQEVVPWLPLHAETRKMNRTTLGHAHRIPVQNKFPKHLLKN